MFGKVSVSGKRAAAEGRHYLSRPRTNQHGPRRRRVGLADPRGGKRAPGRGAWPAQGVRRRVRRRPVRLGGPRAARRTGASRARSILILGSRLKTRGVRRTAPGNTAERLLHGAPGPVGLVPWDYEAAPDVPVRRVAVAYINTEDGRAALLTAASMALELHAELQLVTVAPDTRVMPSLGEPSIYRDEERDSYAAALDEASRILPEGLVPSTGLLGGPVVDALADL